MMRFGYILALVCMLGLPALAHAASPSTEAYFSESAEILGQLFASRLHVSTQIHSHAELGSRMASRMRNQCGATGRYQFLFSHKRLYVLQVWKGKGEINRTLEIVRGADVETFRLLSAAYARDAEHIYVIERFMSEAGKCRYRVVPLEGADVETFRTNPGSVRFMAADADHRYWFGERM